jgi:hypothetical protein
MIVLCLDTRKDVMGHKRPTRLIPKLLNGSSVMDSGLSLRAIDVGSATAVADDVSQALQIHAAHFVLRAGYSRLLRTMVFPHPSAPHDQKTLLQFQRVLDDYDSHLVLGIVWQASEFVSKGASATAGLTQEKNECLNSHRLAVRLSLRPSDLAKTNTRVRSIAIAASAYGLVERKTKHPTRVDLKGTLLLHKFMMEIALQSTVVTNEPAPFWPMNESSDQAFAMPGEQNGQ